MYIVNNLTSREVILQEAMSCEGYKRLIGNYSREDFENIVKILKPYESIVLLKNFQ